MAIKSERMERRKATNPDASEEWALTPQQEAAVDLLATGRTVTDTADAVGVARQTVSEWVNQHYGFRAALPVMLARVTPAHDAPAQRVC
jgi:DNA-binding NarL/FixJ family response regulator